MSDLLTYALRYAELGQPVIPLYWIDESGLCGCKNVNCKSPGKHPLVKNGIKDATTDQAIINRWWGRYPQANIGGACGVLFDAIDVDPRNGGIESINGDEEALSTLLCQHTGGGGFHYLVRPGLELSPRPGIDIKKTGGYIVLEPSLTQSHYYFDDWDVLNESIPKIKQPPEHFIAKPKQVNANPKGKPITKDQIIELRSALNCFDTNDYERWIRFGICLKGLGDVGRSLFFDWSMQFENYDSVETQKKWESFSPTSAHYQSIFYEAYNIGWKEPSKLSIIDDDDNWFVNADELTGKAKAPDYFIYGILESDSHGILGGSSGAYKSFMLLKMAHCIASGQPFFNHRVFEKNKVVYVCGEGQGGLSRRLKALSIFEGGINENLKILNKNIRIDNEEDIKALAIKIQKLRPAVVMFDTFSSMNSRTQENDNSDVASALNLIHTNLSNGFTSTIISHHFGKEEERGLRGASAFTANSDFVMTMKKDAETNDAILKSIKCKDGDNFSDITVRSKIIDLGFVDQAMNPVTSLVLFQETSAKKVSITDKFNEYYEASLLDDPVTINGEIGVTRRYFCNYVQNMVGEKSEYLRVQLSKHMRSGIYKINILEINNILVRNV